MTGRATMDSLLFNTTLAELVHRGLKTETRRVGYTNVKEDTPFYARERFRLPAAYNTQSPNDALGLARRRLVKLPVWFDARGPHPREGRWGRGRPGIHLPQKLARTRALCLERRTEPLHKIDDAGAVAEGFASRDDFMRAWIDMYGRQHWLDNPTITVIRFTLIPRRISE